METSNLGISRVLVEVGSISSIFPRVKGIYVRRGRYATQPLHFLGCLHVNKVSELGTQAAPTPYQMCSELRNLRKCLEVRQPLQAERVNLGWRGLIHYCIIPFHLLYSAFHMYMANRKRKIVVWLSSCRVRFPYHFSHASLPYFARLESTHSYPLIWVRFHSKGDMEDPWNPELNCLFISLVLQSLRRRAQSSCTSSDVHSDTKLFPSSLLLWTHPQLDRTWTRGTANAAEGGITGR